VAKVLIQPDKKKNDLCGTTLTVTFKTETVSEIPRKLTIMTSFSGKEAVINTQLQKLISDWVLWEDRVV